MVAGNSTLLVSEFERSTVRFSAVLEFRRTVTKTLFVPPSSGMLERFKVNSRRGDNAIAVTEVR